MAAALKVASSSVMPETMSVERRQLTKAHGGRAQVLSLSDGAKGMKGAIAVAEEIAAQMPGSFIPRPVRQPAKNPKAHMRPPVP